MAEVTREDVGELEECLRRNLELTSVRFERRIVSGLQNKAACFHTDQGPLFVKYSNTSHAYDEYNSEIKNLLLISSTRAIHVPQPRSLLKLPNGAALVLEYLDDLKPTENWEALGEGIGKLHTFNKDLLKSEEARAGSVHASHGAAVKNYSSDVSVYAEEALSHGARKYGSDSSVYFGKDFSIPAGTWNADWTEYFMRHMMEPLFLSLEREHGDREIMELWSELQIKVHKIFDNVPCVPSILHGDFCNINVGEFRSKPVTFDPKSIYGHSELDLLQPLTPVFDDQHYLSGFSPSFFDSYHRYQPKAPGFDTRMRLYQGFLSALAWHYVPTAASARDLTSKGIKEILEHL